jgi:primosomal protein N' (replication factor Y)
MRVSVSFGRRHTVGLVTRLTTQSPAGVKNMKSLETLLDTEPILTPDLLELGRWISDYYYCSLGEALFTALPGGYRKNPKAFLKLVPGALQKSSEVETLLEKIGKLRGVNLESLEEGRVPLTPRTHALAEALKASGLGQVLFSTEAKKPKVARNSTAPNPVIPKLHPQQEDALRAINQALSLQTFHTFLLHGVTGSGKTEVYLRAIAEVIQKGQQAIVLIPEIALTPQTLERFTSRFGDQVALLHSRLAQGERARQWSRMATGEAKVAVGARSALFAPAPRLGLIVVDEEHESSYKQEDVPRYHARDAAVKRAQINGAVAILGSATPSLESVHNAQSGKYQLLHMPNRVNQKRLPLIRLVDLKEELMSRGDKERPVLTLSLETAMRETLEKGEQIILFLNRRGFHTLVLCSKCGEQVQCPHCSISVTYHRQGSQGGSNQRAEGPKPLLCHYCGWQGPVPVHCPSCKDGDVQPVGMGTEKVEEEVQARFPKARVARMDLDTTRRQGSHEDILKKFREHKTDILIGTQMIAKGHDFPGVTLVGVIGADVGLALPDFRAPERVFQLMVQVAGRAGRAEKEGEIYLQTFNPGHPALRAAMDHDTETFWKMELETRRSLEYPPFSKLGLVVYRSKDEKKALLAATKAAEILRRGASTVQESNHNNDRARGEQGRTHSTSSGPAAEVWGPAPAPFSKLRGQYRFQILMKAKTPAPLRRLLTYLDEKMEIPSGVNRAVDLDPQSML